ncbi:excisionase family DNA binding protein [Nocardioides salarius]|uniref:Excisionase family DNA binding protein n=1 Tax=Nocardioides salarius TaxID=374513 RepID=A0ABS2MFR4_9ACTN|nr:helix-turn-helix domain-containing protein [Nocardioides salarius]MBM7510031.1 excisionase family DNA binding protein [Nocardioides salarius]
MTVPEVAEALRVNKVTVRRWIKAGTLPAVKVGRDYRIQATDVAAMTEAAS